MQQLLRTVQATAEARGVDRDVEMYVDLFDDALRCAREDSHRVTMHFRALRVLLATVFGMSPGFRTALQSVRDYQPSTDVGVDAA